jgi:chemotaxis protein histidine kinase CheA
MNYSAAIESGLTTMLAQFGRSIVSELSSHFKFDLEEAMRIAGIDQISLEKKTKTTTEKAPKEKAVKAPKEKKEKAPKAPKEKVERLVPSFALPFCGVVVDEWCKGVRANHELYTQCTAEPMTNDKFCKACRKAADGNDGAHPFGEITERASKGLMDYEIRGKKVVPYGNVLAKLGKSREEAIAEAARFGWEIAEEQFETRKGARGRPRTTSDKSDDETEAKKRGRPRKAVEVVNGSAKGDDMIATLVRTARAAEAADSSEEVEPEGTSLEEPAEVENPWKAAAEEQKKKQEADKAQEIEAAKAIKNFNKAIDKLKSKEEKAAAKEAEKAAAKAAKEAEKAAAKAAKEAEKAAAKAAKEAAKAATKPSTKPAPKKKENAPAPVAAPQTPVAPLVAAAAAIEQEESSDEEEQIEVKPIKINGKSYLLATNGKYQGKLYDRATNKGVGFWNEETKEIEELPQDMMSDDEEEEEDDE